MREYSFNIMLFFKIRNIFNKLKTGFINIFIDI